MDWSNCSTSLLKRMFDDVFRDELVEVLWRLGAGMGGAGGGVLLKAIATITLIFFNFSVIKSRFDC